MQGLVVITACIVLIMLMHKSQTSMNIALHKNASQSSNYDTIKFHAYLGVNGNRSRDRSQCTHTKPFQQGTQQPREAWWQVDLGSLSEIKSIQIYYDFSTGYRFNNFKMYLSQTSETWRNEAPCFVDTEPGYSAPEFTVNCTGYGKFVTVFVNNTDRHFMEPILELCEVEVYGCPIGEYGPGCNYTCPSKCVNDRCNPDSGSCKGVNGSETHGPNAVISMLHHALTNFGYEEKDCVIHADNFVACPLRTYGMNCTNDCNCLHGSCDIVSGKCANSVCQDGWKGDKCNDPCSVNNFGTNCNRRCNCEIEGCNHVNGKCNKQGCDQGWKGDSCSEPCQETHFGRDCNNVCHCNNGSCDSIVGKCKIPGCQVGWHGDSCSTACDETNFGRDCNNVCHCNNGSCDSIVGNCKIPGCQAGWHGESCNTACQETHFGRDCNNVCHCNNGSCDSIIGKCKILGCLAGWHGDSCSTGCSDEKYGPDCIYMCNCLRGKCDSKTGKCIEEGCKTGWKGENCNKRCGNRTFGPGCMDRCYCKIGGCKHVTGVCEVQGCISGWQGESCNEKVLEKDNNNLLYAIVGGIIGLLFASTVFLILILLVFWRRLKSKSKKATVYEDMHMNDLKNKTESAYDELQSPDYTNTSLSSDSRERSGSNMQI